MCATFAVLGRLYLLTKSKARPKLRVVNNFASGPAKLSPFESFEIQHKTPVVRKLPPIPMAHYGGRHHVTMLKGSGIGPECMAMVMQIFAPSKMAPYRSICSTNDLHSKAANKREAQVFSHTVTNGLFMKIAQNVETLAKKAVSQPNLNKRFLIWMPQSFCQGLRPNREEICC